MNSSTGMLNPRRRPSAQSMISMEGWFVYSWRNPGGVEPGDAATPAADRWIRWGGPNNNRLIIIGGAKISGLASAIYKQITMPLAGSTVEVIGGAPRTVAPPSATLSCDYGGIPLAAWEALWLRVDWSNPNVAETQDKLIITSGNSNTDTSRLLESDPNVEWVLICAARSTSTILLWNGDTLRRGQEIGMRGSVAAQVLLDRQQQDAVSLRGNFFSTATRAFGFAGVIKKAGPAGNGTAWGEAGSADVVNPPAGTTVRVIGGPNSGTTVTWRTPAAADQMESFGLASAAGNFPLTTSTVLDKPGNAGTLFHHQRIGTASAGDAVLAASSWFYVETDTTADSSVPSTWLPLAMLGGVGLSNQSTLLVPTGVVLERHDIALDGTRARDLAVAHRAHWTSVPSCRWTSPTFFQVGAVPNGSTRLAAPSFGVMVGWDDTSLILSAALPSGDTAPANRLAANVPPVGFAIPVHGIPGATRVVQTLAGTGRRFIPLYQDETLVYRAGTQVGFDARAYLVIAADTSPSPPPLMDAIEVVHTSGTSDGANAARVAFCGGITLSPGLYKAVGTAEAWGDGADSHNYWTPVVLPGQTPPGGTVALAAVANFGGAVSGAPAYIVMHHQGAHRKTCQVQMARALTGNVPDGSMIGFLPGVYQVNTPRRAQAMVFGAVPSAGRPRLCMVLLTNTTIGGVKGTSISIAGANTVSNPGLTQGDATWGTPTEVWLDLTFDVY